MPHRTSIVLCFVPGCDEITPFELPIDANETVPICEKHIKAWRDSVARREVLPKTRDKHGSLGANMVFELWSRTEAQGMSQEELADRIDELI